MQIQFRHIDPHPLLKGYIEKMWLFESTGQAFGSDIKLIVPNGRIKIAMPYRNGIVAKAEGWYHSTKEHSITLVGQMDAPSTMDFAMDAASGTICAEFSPYGAYRFFHLRLSELRNRVFSRTDILGNTAKQLEEQITNAKSIDDKVSLFQRFLLKQFLLHREDSIFEYATKKIKSSEGKITIKELEKEIGYSGRYLNMKFTEKMGISPKNFASVIRFRQYYEALCDNKGKRFARNNFHDHYYDQSHFIKDFRRFTGSTPANLETKINDFGKIFYNV